MKIANGMQFVNDKLSLGNGIISVGLKIHIVLHLTD